MEVSTDEDGEDEDEDDADSEEADDEEWDPSLATPAIGRRRRARSDSHKATVGFATALNSKRQLCFGSHDLLSLLTYGSGAHAHLSVSHTTHKHLINNPNRPYPHVSAQGSDCDSSARQEAECNCDICVTNGLSSSYMCIHRATWQRVRHFGYYVGVQIVMS